jgi:dihydropteroate synthase
LSSPVYAKKVADACLPAILMAANYNPGDAVGIGATMTTLQTVVDRCKSAGIDNYVLDPGVGYWSPLRSLDNDWELCQNYERFSEFGRPVLAAISRKSFIGNLVNREPEGRLAGSLAVTMVLLQKGASMVRTHDVPHTRDLISVFERMVKRP